jgi:hypothetical protein
MGKNFSVVSEYIVGLLMLVNVQVMPFFLRIGKQDVSHPICAGERVGKVIQLCHEGRG